MAAADRRDRARPQCRPRRSESAPWARCQSDTNAARHPRFTDADSGGRRTRRKIRRRCRARPAGRIRSQPDRLRASGCLPVDRDRSVTVTVTVTVAAATQAESPGIGLVLPVGEQRAWMTRQDLHFSPFGRAAPPRAAADHARLPGPLPPHPQSPSPRHSPPSAAALPLIPLTSSHSHNRAFPSIWFIFARGVPRARRRPILH